MRLHDQIVAVERATNSNRSIDGDVVELLNLQPQGFKRAAGSQPELFRDSTGAARIQTWLAPKLMNSVDDALGLLTPGWRLESLSDAGPGHRARCILERDDGSKVVGYGCNRSAAALAAVLRSKAHDRGSPMPRSSEHAAEVEPVIAREREQPEMRISA
ncbi:MAG: hypothetical protein ACJ75S_07040 [Solirubrobacterales bacterium]|jgi:hypothetical protein